MRTTGFPEIALQLYTTSDSGPTSTLGTHDEGVEYCIYTQAFETDMSLKISDDGHTSLSSRPITAKVAIVEENNVPSTPDFFVPKASHLMLAGKPILSFHCLAKAAVSGLRIKGEKCNFVVKHRSLP